MPTTDFNTSETKRIIPPICISLLCFIYKLIFCSTLPWVDEVMLADPAINYLLNGTWSSTANHISFSLDQLLLVPWLYVFGVSHAAVYAFSAFWAFLSSVVLIYILYRKHLITTAIGLCSIVCLFWCAHEMDFMSTNGRLDTLVMFLTLVLVFFLLNNSQDKIKNSISIFVTSFILFWAGVTSLPFVMVAMFIVFVSGACDRKLVITQGCSMVAGIVCSWLFNAGLYYINGCYGYYKHLYFSYSATLNNKESISFFNRLLECYSVNIEACVLCVVNILLFFVVYKWKYNISKISLAYFIAYLCIPLSMCIAGRYPIYYTWSFWVSGVVCFVWLVCQLSLHFQRLFLICLSTIFVLYGLYPYILKDNKQYDKMKAFISQQEFKKDDVIISHYAPYFEIVKNVERSYFCAEYWMELPQNIDYVIICPKQFGADGLYNIVANLKEQGCAVLLQSELHDGSIQVYRVESCPKILQ